MYALQIFLTLTRGGEQFLKVLELDPKGPGEKEQLTISIWIK